MSTTPQTDGTEATSLDEQFLDLVCGDAQLLAAEFEEIIAEWDEPPGDRPGGDAAGRSPGRGPTTRLAREPRGIAARTRPRRPGIGGWSRQRSPPDAPDAPIRGHDSYQQSDVMKGR